MSQTSIYFFLLLALLLSTIVCTSASSAVDSDNPLKNAPKLEKSSGSLPKAKLLCTPEVKTLLGYTRRILHLNDGHTLAVFSYSNSANANWLFLIDGNDLSAERISIPNGDIASHAAALGADGDIYVMPYHTGRAYRFHVKEKRWEDIKVDVPGGDYTWDALGASNGCIYFGTYPNACFAEYDTKTGKTSLWKQVAADTKYVTDFSEDDEGRIRFRAWGPEQCWRLFDPKSRELTSTTAPADAQPELPKPPKEDESFMRRIKAGDRSFAISFPTSRFWEVMGDGEFILRGDPRGPAESWYLEAVDGAVIGISHFGVTFRYDLTSGEINRSQLPNSAPGGNVIIFLEAITPHYVIGSNYSQQNLFKIDPETGKTDYPPGLVAQACGEVKCGVGLDGKAYLGMYINSVMSVYDPKLPFVHGKNPRKLIELGEKYQQTRPRCAVTDGKLAFISSDSAYSHLGGALVVIDPKTEKVDVYHHLIKDQNLPTLAYDKVTKLLWGGTDRWGQMRSHPPTQESSLIYAFDPATRKVAHTLTPWPKSDETSVLGVSQNGTLVAASGAEIALIDTKTREILYKGASPIGVPSRLCRGTDGLDYCLSEGTLYRWDLKLNTLAPVASAPGCTFLTEAGDGKWVLADAMSVYSVDIKNGK